MSIYIGIDPGVNTGLAIWNKAEKKFLKIETMGIVKAMNEVQTIYKGNPSGVTVVFEDARERKWFGNAGREQLQGAGSIKRDCSIWEEFLTQIGVTFRTVAPKNNRTKLDAKQFVQYTKWTGRTNEHGRDAAMLVLNS